MNHPPIQSRCCSLFIIKDKVYLTIHELRGSLSQDTAEGRRLISDYCRCAWLDELERLKAMNIGLFSNPEALEIHQEYIRNCTANAAAWKAWGEER